jgi:hypothetical protein
MSGHWPFHEKTHIYYVWCLSISWQNTLLLCLVLHYFMTKHTATMPGAWPFHDKQIDTMSSSWPLHDKTHFCYVWCLTIAWQKTLLLCLMLDHSRQYTLLFCLVLDHFMTKHTATMSGAWPFHDKQTDTISGAWPFHDKTHCYYV